MKPMKLGGQLAAAAETGKEKADRQATPGLLKIMPEQATLCQAETFPIPSPSNRQTSNKQ